MNCVKGHACVWAALAALSAAPTACIRYTPRPIDPPRLENQYRSRSLEDPGLRAFLNATELVSLDLQTLTMIAFYYSPDLDVARSDFAAAQAALITAGERINPSLDSEGGYNTEAGAHALYSFLPRFTIRTAGKRGYHLLEAQQQSEAARVALAETAWRVRSRVRAALYDHVLAVRRRDSLGNEEGIRSEIVAIFDKRLEVGEAARPELDVFRVDLITTRAALQKAEGEVAQTRAALANAVGLPAAALEGASIEAAKIETPPSEQELPLRTVERAGLLHRADVRKLLAEYAAADAGLRLEVARQYPDIQLGPGYNFEEGFARYIVGSTLPAVPVFHRNRGAIAQAEAQRERVAAQFTALQAKAIGELDVALAQYRGALAELRDAERTIGVQQDREKASRRSLEVGEGDRLGLATARLQTVAAAHARLDALTRAQAALGALEDAVQQPLEAGVVLPEPALTSPRKGATP